MKYLDKLVAARWGVKVYGHYDGFSVEITRPDAGTYWYRRPTLGAALKAAWKESGVRNP